MVHILGINLPDTNTVRFALTKIYGVGHHTSHRLCARLQIHDKCRMRDLSPFQVTSLASFLSSPATAPPLPRYPLATPDYVPPSISVPSQKLLADLNMKHKAKKVKNMDPLRNLKIESELRTLIRDNIAHQRMIGSYVGRRHAMHLPVRGQNTQNNAKNAKKFNRLDRAR